MLLIYTPHSTPRLAYTMRLFFETLIPCSYEITNDLAFFTVSSQPKFSYSKEQVGESILHFQSADLLFENSILQFDLDDVTLPFGDKKTLGFFRTGRSSCSFDLFASAFFLVSRYEEYTATSFDEHDRFEAENSIAYKHNFLDSPMVNWYALFLKHKLKEAYPSIAFIENSPSVLNTVDVDMAWKYKNKGFYRNLGAFIRSLISLDIRDVFNQIRVLFSIKKDLYQQFGFLIKESSSIPIIFFWLLGKLGKYDKNIDPKNKAFQTLINDVSESADTGIHLSYLSHNYQNGFECEVQTLSHIINDKIVKNRFHFLKFQLPISYQKLVEAGVGEDYSMGYAKHSGFRASIANAFYWYDLRQEKQTTLMIYPFVFMDATIRYHQSQNDEWIKNKLESYLDRIIEVKGTCIVLWHNDTFEAMENDWQVIYIWWNDLVRKRLGL